MGMVAMRRNPFAFVIALAGAACFGQPVTTTSAPAVSVAPTAPLNECGEDWFRTILTSATYRDYLDGRLGPRTIGGVEFAKLTLADSFMPKPRWDMAQRAWFFDSNPYSAAALYNALQGPHGDPSSCHWLTSELFFRLRNRNAREVEAAMFAHIRDKPSFEKRPFLDTHRWVGNQFREANMFAEFAERLQRQSQPYMAEEWQRLQRFEHNPEAKAAASAALAADPSDVGAREFSRLVADIRDLRERALHMSVFRPDLVRPAPEEPQEVRTIDVTGIHFGQPLIYQMQCLRIGLGPGTSRASPSRAEYEGSYCQLVIRSEDRPVWLSRNPPDSLPSGQLALQGTPANLEAMAKLMDLIRKRRGGVVGFDRGRVSMVYPTDKLSDNDFLRSFDTLHAVAKPAFLVPQGVLVVHTEAASQGAAAQLLEAIEGRREIVVPWPDGTQVAVLLSDRPFLEEGLREFLQKHLPAREDCRFVEINSYRPIVVLKASAASIDAFRRGLRGPTTAPTTGPTGAEERVGAAHPIARHGMGSR